MILASFLQDNDFITALYIVAFSLFVIGIAGLTGPRTAVRGNRIAAVGMAIAVVGTLLDERIGDWGLIVLGIAIGTAVGVPAARNVKMTAMPQMVALFNGVGGGAIALIAWVEFRHTGGYAGEPLYVVIASLFGAIVGSISFWGSNIAFGKLQEILPGRPITLGRAQQVLNLLLLIVAGMIVGASGTILTNLMAEAMNRSIPNIIAGGFGGGAIALIA
ncbi:MAG TPA: NAD(P)(+) transhydrogenase (Re/Si-specific) subunit beta, partial [Solirubrobacteraceae bacterium]